MNKAKIERVQNIYNEIEKIFQLKEQVNLEELKEESHPNHFLLELLNKGTKKDKFTAIQELALKEQNLFRFVFQKLFAMMTQEFNKKNFQMFQTMKDIIINYYGKYANKTLNEEKKIYFKDFRELLQDKSYLMSNFMQNKLTEENKEELLRFYKMNYIKSRVEKFHSALLTIKVQDINILQQDYIDLIIEIVKKTESKVSLQFSQVLVNKLGEKNNRIVEKVSKTLVILINNYSDLSLPLVQLIVEFINRSNQTLLAKQHSVAVLGNCNFTKIEDQNVGVFLMNFFLQQVKVFINFCLKDPKYLKKKLLKEKFQNKKLKLKNVNVTLQNLLKEKMEKESSLLNNYFRGIIKIIPQIKKMDQFDSFFDENLPFFFKFCRISTHKMSIKIMALLFSIFKHDFYSKLCERFLTLFYEYINTPEVYMGKTCEHIFNLLFNIAKLDYSVPRIQSFIKRLFQIVIHCDSKVILGALILLSKIVPIQEGLKNLIKQPISSIKQKDFDKESVESVENYKDIDSDKEEEEVVKEVETKPEVVEKENLVYDDMKRNPLYAGGDKALLWELLYLQNHYNPIVRKITYLIIDLKFSEIQYKGNPIKDLTSISILNRFALVPLKQSQTMKTKMKIKRPNQITYDNYKTQLMEDEKAIEIYFDEKIQKLNAQEDKNKKRMNKFNVEDEEEDIDRYADELFQNEMKKNEVNDAEFLDDEDIDIESDDSYYEQEEDLHQQKIKVNQLQ